jgi:hypothetical protein
MGPIRCPETSVNNYHTTPRNIPKDRRSNQHRGGSLKSGFDDNCPVNFDVSHTLCVFVKEAILDLWPADSNLMLCITSCGCKSEPIYDQLSTEQCIVKVEITFLSILFPSKPWKRSLLPPFSWPTDWALRRKVSQCHLMSLAKLQAERTLVLGTDIKCRLYSYNSIADFAKSTAASTLLYSSMESRVIRVQAFKNISEKQTGVKTVLCKEGTKCRTYESCLSVFHIFE